MMDKKRSLFLPEDENLREKGDWSQFTLWQQGKTFCISSLSPIPLSQSNIRSSNTVFSRTVFVITESAEEGS